MKKFLFLIFLIFLISILIGPAGFDKEIILNLRIPRTLNAIFVGSSLSLSGLLLQTLFKNPLLEPYLIGTSSGAALFSFLSLFIPLNFIFKTPLFSFIGSISAILIIILISKFLEYNPYKILLLGISISLIFSSILAFLIYYSHSERIKIFFYLFGSLSKSSWFSFFIIFFSFIFVFLYFLIKNKELDIILLSEEESFSLGVDPKKIYIKILLFSSFLTGITVSFTGIIGFVGLIVPHISRILKGEKHINLIPYSALIGGILLLLCDNFSRIILEGVEIPVGIITSFIGVPFFIYLIFKSI